MDKWMDKWILMSSWDKNWINPLGSRVREKPPEEELDFSWRKTQARQIINKAFHIFLEKLQNSIA